MHTRTFSKTKKNGNTSLLNNSIDVYVPLFNIPKPFRSWCHACKKGFMSIDENQAHDKTTEHIRNKEIYLQVK